MYLEAGLSRLIAPEPGLFLIEEISYLGLCVLIKVGFLDFGALFSSVDVSVLY